LIWPASLAKEAKLLCFGFANPRSGAKEALVKSKCSHLFNSFFLFFSTLQGEAHCSALRCEAEHHFSALRRRRSGGQSPMLRFDLAKPNCFALRTAVRFGFANAKEANPHHSAMRCIGFALQRGLASPKEAWNKI
jgi:hypothetical protein